MNMIKPKRDTHRLPLLILTLFAVQLLLSTAVHQKGTLAWRSLTGGPLHGVTRACAQKHSSVSNSGHMKATTTRPDRELNVTFYVRE